MFPSIHACLRAPQKSAVSQFPTPSVPVEAAEETAVLECDRTRILRPRPSSPRAAAEYADDFNPFLGVSSFGASSVHELIPHQWGLSWRPPQSTIRSGWTRTCSSSGHERQEGRRWRWRRQQRGSVDVPVRQVRGRLQDGGREGPSG